MDFPFFHFGDQSNGDVKLLIHYSDGYTYSGNPVYLHSQVLKKSRDFEARLSPSQFSFPEIYEKLPRDGSAENYLDCIRLMYSFQWGRQLSFFSNLDDALRILPVASKLQFEEGIQACMEYLEGVCWTPKQKLRIRVLLSSLQVNIPTDLAERLRMSKPLFDEKLEFFKNTVPQMLSEILNKPFVPYGVPLVHMQDRVKKQIIACFQEDIHPAIQNTCRDALLNEFRIRIEGIKGGSSTEIRDSACESLLWLLDLIKLCKRGLFEAAFTIFVEDEGIADILAKPQLIHKDLNFSQSDRSYSGRVLEILVHRLLDALANGDIIIPKRARVSFLIKWVPVIGFLICRFACVHNESELIDCSSSYSPEPFSSLRYFSNPAPHLKFSERFEEGVSKILASLSPSDQKQILNSLIDTSNKFQTWERGIFHWWIKMLSMAVMAVNGNHLQIE